MQKSIDLQNKLDAIKSLKVSDKHNLVWDAMARNILADDLGEFSDSFKQDYEMDDITRDRLIAHARSDAAMGYVAIRDTHTMVQAAKKYAQRAAMFSFITMCIAIYVAYRLS